MILVAVALLVPLPTAVQLRDWATSVGPWFPLAFLAAHVVVTVFPFPRTAFTLAAGLLFGPLLGVSLAVMASTISAVIALLLVRAAGWQLSRLVKHPRVDALDCAAAERGLAGDPVDADDSGRAVLGAQLRGGLRPRSGWCPTRLATFVGLLPGTAAVVILGDALTGNVSPLLFLVSLCTASLGVAGLVVRDPDHRRQHAGRYTVRADEPVASSGGHCPLTDGPLTVIVPNNARNDAAATRAGLQSFALTWTDTASTK